MNKNLFCLWTSLILTISALLIMFNINNIFDYILNTELSIYPGSTMYENWKIPKMPMTLTIYTFNCTNTHEMNNKNFKPNFVELGPYKFNVFHENMDVTWNSNNTITYRHIRRWYFDIQKSNGSLEDKNTNINPAPLTASYLTRYWSAIGSIPLSTMISMVEKSVWITGSVGEFVFDGISDPLLVILNSITGVSPIKIPADKIALFYKRNDSDSIYGILNIGTGTGSISSLGVFRNWNYRNHTPFSKGKCSEIAGSPAGIFPPGQTREIPVKMFLLDICRYVTLVYKEDTEVLGIPGYRYVLTKDVIDNGAGDPENECNCDGECLPSGVLNVSDCREGPPAFVSFPHFMDADPYYINQSTGLKPYRKNHEFYVVLEPKTGVILDYSVRLQMNMYLQRNFKIRLYQNVPNMMFPLLWMDEHGSLTAEIAASIKLLLMLPTIMFYFSIALLILGLLILTIYLLQLRKKRKYTMKVSFTKADKNQEEEEHQPQAH